MCDRIKYRSNKDKTAVETAPTQTMSASADGRKKQMQQTAVETASTQTMSASADGRKKRNFHRRFFNPRRRVLSV